MGVSISTPTSSPTTALSLAERHAMLWLIGILGVQLACQSALMFEQFAPMRVVFRTLTFLVSLAGLALVQGRAIRHPSQTFGVLAIAILGLNIFHPTTNTLLAGVAQTTLYLAIMAPIFWVPRLWVTPNVFARLMASIWTWYTLSAVVGVLQVYFPGYLQPALSTNVRGMGDLADGLKITLADGTQTWRPMGLTDTPGGAGPAGLFAFMFGMGYFVNSDRFWLRAGGLSAMMIGLFCIYLCQTRSLLVMAGVAAIVFVGMLACTGRYARAGRVLLVVPAVAISSFGWAIAQGGESVSQRYETLISDDPTSVYYKNRGLFLEDTIDVLLPRYPLGAGLGRWGMMRGYFGDPNDPYTDLIWVEIQWTGWLLDGGLPLILAYTLAVAAACYVTARACILSRNPWLSGWAGLILAYDVGAVAVTFNYPLFIGQGGMEFWLLNSALFTAALSRRTSFPCSENSSNTPSIN